MPKLQRSLLWKTGGAWFALGVGLLATVFGSLHVKQDIEQDAVSQFAFTCDQVTLKIQERLGAYALILRGGSGLFAASVEVDRQEWRDYVETLHAERNVPGVEGIGFAQVIPAAGLANHIARIRGEGFPDYTVHPAGERAIYTSIVYLEPFRDRNLSAFGFDMYSEPIRRAAMEQARDSGEAALSGRVELVQDAGAQAGALMYVPVYRNGAPMDTLEQKRTALIGWVYSAYRMNDLMTGILRDWVSQEGKTIDLHIYDGLRPIPASLLIDSKPASSPDLNSLFYQQRMLDFNGHQWLLVFDNIESLSGISYAPAWAALAGGLTLNGLLFWLMLALINTRVNAIRIADKLTGEIRHSQELLKESEFRWKFAIEGPGDGLLDWNLADNSVFFSKSWKEMLGFTEDEIGNGLEELTQRIHPEDTANAQATIQDYLDGKTPVYVSDYRVRCKDGSYKWVHDRGMIVSRSKDGKPLRMIGTHRDITERKLAEEELRSSEERLSIITSSAQDAIIMLDDAGNIEFWNEAAGRIFGNARAEVLGHNLHTMLVPLSFREAHRRAFPHFQQTGQGAAVGKTLELSGLRKDGSEFPLELSLSAVHMKGAWHSIGILRDITERKLLEDEREEALSRLHKIASRVPGVVYQYRLRPDGSSCMPFASEAIREIFHLIPEEVSADASKIFAAIHPDDYGEFVASVQKSAQDLIPWRHECRVKFGDGTVRWLFGDALPEREVDGSTLWHGFITDITERKQAEEKLQLAASVFTHAREGIMITADDGAIIDVNDAFCDITGYSRDEVLGQNPRLLSSDLQEIEFHAAMARDLIEKDHWYGELWNRRKNGEVYAVMQTISAVRDTQGNIRQYVALFSDITPLKEHERQLEHIAHYDTLTSLPNRVLLADRLHQGMAQTRRRGQLLAVAFLDLDGFKSINDNHGHKAGDQLLIALASRMAKTLREGDTLARLGGDEFVAVLLDLTDVETSVPMLTRLLTAAAQPVQSGDLVLQVSSSIGVTFYPQAEDIDADQLLRQADQSMYQAKLAGKNRYHVFDAEQDCSIRGHHESLENIRRALTEREFVLYYQPKVNMRTGEVIGAEALIRWQHPERGLLPPDLFLPVINNHPLAVEVGEWVIDAALTQMVLWHAVGLEIQVSVNIGAHQLQQADFVERLRAHLAAHPEIMPCCFELEVLETSALEDLPRVSHVIEACREMGVMFALDDFGTGYSSLTYLKRLSVAQLKIDQSFVRDMFDDPDNLAILEGMVSLATALHRQVIAEGVETAEHGEMLLQLGCDLAQGYYIARPMQAHELAAWSAAWHPNPAWGNLPCIKHDDLPLLFAGTEQRVWVAAISSYLMGMREAPPPLDTQCRFGMWLSAEGLARHATQPTFATLKPLFQKLRSLAAELCELHARGCTPEALARLGELRGLLDALLEQLQAMIQAIRQ
ncbi:PAS domain S-box protein [Methylomonas montana]|uniref:PAS domain S-box protein n=1 Tax=Methylomonas montana TaxID=3058963 RepID=UPI002658D9E3|nr:PAS domain S-box protein [Methylomonas montana]WKJ91013.1 PAS domain S-box protein [Methylomonas montana]